MECGCRGLWIKSCVYLKICGCLETERPYNIVISCIGYHMLFGRLNNELLFKNSNKCASR